MNEKQSKFIAALGEVLFDVPAARRPAHSDAVATLLKAVDLELSDHNYLLGERFRHKIPALKAPSSSARRRFRFTLSEGSWPEEANHPSFATGHTSYDELTHYVHRTRRMIDNYFKDATRRDAGTTCFNVSTGRRDFLLRVELTFPEGGNDSPTLAQALKQAPAKRSY